jgi:AcrR family transcriptional regulator
LANTVTSLTRPKSAPPEARGPIEHERREQILAAADTYFRTYGYTKTTVADLAKAIGLSKAYIYKFFDSKQAIGEAVCGKTLGTITAELREIAGGKRPVATRLRLIYRTIARRGAELHFSERKLYELAVIACIEKWRPVRNQQAELLGIIHELITEGRKSGDFEQKTPIGEVSLAILQTLELFSPPLLLEQNFDGSESKAESVANLVLRSLAPLR